MELLPGESVLLTSNDQKVILTDQRIQMTDTLDTKSFTVVIFLENVSSVITHHKGNMVMAASAAALIFIGLLAIAFGFVTWTAAVFLGFGMALVLGWWFSVKQVVTIVADSGNKIHFSVDGMAQDKIASFLHTVMLARQKRTL